MFDDLMYQSIFLHNFLCDLPYNPRSRGCGRQQRILLRCRSLVPALVNPHGLTNNAMLGPDAMNVPDGHLVHGVVDQRHGRKEVKHHSWET
jgi:hypothetical protein